MRIADDARRRATASGRKLSSTTAGGKLGIHADFRINNQLHLYRRMNRVNYLIDGWRDGYGCSLELWNRKMTVPVKRVAPVFNRCLIFNTDAV